MCENNNQNNLDNLEIDNYIYLNEKEMIIYNPLKKDVKTKYKNVYCVNCGEKGHVVKECVNPITSFGIVAFKVINCPDDEIGDINDSLKNILNYNENSKKQYPYIKFLMIQRKDTMGYTDFVRGKYPDDIIKLKEVLSIFIKEMTEQEKNNLLTKTFDEIWDTLWVNHESKCFKNEYEAAYKKYQNLDVPKLIREFGNLTSFEHTEFGYPKGRRNMRETNIGCAEREFYEETGYDKSCYDFIKNYPIIHEEFIGTNGIEYRHIYYLVKMKSGIPAPKIDYKNKIQTGEVQNIGWLTYEECMKVIRPYDTAKKGVVEKVNNDIIAMNNNYVCSNFYYTSKRTFQRQSPFKTYKPFYKNFQPKSI